MKINETDFSLLGLTGRTVFDLCRSVRAASDLIAILSRYNTGSPTPRMANHYARPVIADMDSVRGSSAAADSSAAAPHDPTYRRVPNVGITHHVCS
jgi:hypothetical protein